MRWRWWICGPVDLKNIFPGERRGGLGSGDEDAFEVGLEGGEAVGEAVLQPEDDLRGGLAVRLGEFFVNHSGHQVASQPKDQVVDFGASAFDFGEAGDGAEEFCDAGFCDVEEIS